MRVSLRKLTVIIISVLVGLGVLLLAARYFVFNKIQQALDTRLDDFQKSGFRFTYETSNIDIIAGKIELRQFTVTHANDTANSRFQASIPYVLVKGIDPIRLLWQKRFDIESVAIIQPSITYSPQRAPQNDKASSSPMFENIRIQKLVLTGLHLFIKDSLARDTALNVIGNVTMQNIDLEKEADSMIWKNALIHVDDFAMRATKNMYGVSAKHLHIDLAEQSFMVDDVRIAPVIDRTAFMKKLSRQVDYITATIPFIKITGIDFFSYPGLSVHAEKVATKFAVKIYRDKRYAFKNVHTRRLPSHFVQQLPWKLSADSIVLEDSYAAYEEHAPEGDSAGLLYFNHINATIVDFHNDPKFPHDIRMEITARVMDKGDVNIHLGFPADTLKPYSLQGVVSDLPLNALNGMITPAARLRIESGTLTRMDFSFTYNTVRSDGQLELRYNGLKIVSLKEKDDATAVSHLKTLLLNTFIFKKNVDESSDNTGAGSISFHRDRRRSVFNYWYKSLLSGIITAAELEGIPLTAAEKEKNEKN